MIDGYAHLDTGAANPLLDLEHRFAAAGVRRALIVETWAGDEKPALDELATKTNPDRRVAFCYRDQSESELSAMLAQPGVYALRARTASLERPAPWLAALEESGRILLCHGELGIERLVHALLPISERHPALRIYVPHLAWPRQKKVDDPEWSTCIAVLGTLPNVVLGISGLASFSSTAFPHDDIRSFAETAITAFQSDRILAATDFPYIDKQLYSETYQLAREWITHHAPGWSDDHAFRS